MAGHMMRRTPSNMNGVKEKTDFAALKKMLIYCKQYLPAVVIAIIFAVGGSVATIIGPEKIRDLMNLITDGILTGIDMAGFTEIALTLVVIYAAGAVLSYGGQFITATITQKAAKRLRHDINDKLDKIPLSFFDGTTKGDILSVITNDVDMISQTLAMSSASLISAVTLFVGVTYKMFSSSAVLAAVTVLTAVLGFIGMSIVLKVSQKYFNRKQRHLGEMNGQIEEVYTNHNIVSAFGGTKGERKKFEKVNGLLYEDNWKSQMLSGMNLHIMTFVGNLSYVLIFVIGVALILNGSTVVDLGTIMAFVIYAKLFSQPLSTFAQGMTNIQQASAASTRVFELLEQPELADESEKTGTVDTVVGNVRFDQVRFGYSPDKEIIHGFSADLRSGQKVAIVGPTGAGKTTIVNLLMRFYEMDGGDILVDGVSIKSMKREKVHDLFDMILQDTWLFEGSIRENLVYNTPNVTEKQLDQACEAVGLKHFIETLPQGYDTALNSTLNLSEGQQQQLTIARAMIRNAPLLILDEATSSVDTRTELVIQKAMDQLTEGRTSFVIAHRLSTIKNADIILVIRDGDIIEQGDHQTLLEEKGFYAELYNSQFEQTA